MVLLVCLSLQAPVMGQTVGAVVDCGGKRLAGAERETCASPDLMRLTKDVDQLNATSALHQDYASVVRACVERLLRGRLDALRAAGTSPGSIVSEIGQYSFWSIANFVKWGPELLGKHVRLWGCMALDPGPTPASRIHGTIHDYPPKPRGASVPAIFNTMTEEKATWFYDAKKPCGYWHGVVERRDGRLVLAQMEPNGLN